ncbi:glycosyltransferase [Rhodococcus sp. IEGM 1408]|uniref:glycosyltransferase n=1 Tax=Rhodococcus sp. IEGM 1408 TaxID=3082220 RepID=UPI0029557909|nr:glycosyltransferase [Rhodococcus sp. IEGM 1408]MDV7999965.1 glycosyltransferase [Rhodococcus sp. IEGM 1408]
MRILVLIDGFRLGGAETLLIPFTAAAQEACIAVDLVSVAPMADAAPGVLDQYELAGLTVNSLEIVRLLQPGAVLQLVRYIRQGRHDVVHAHLATAITLAVPAARLARRPVVTSFHTLAPRYEGRARVRERLAVLAATRSDAVLFASRASLDSYAELHYSGVAPTNWRVVHNGIDVAGFRPGPADAGVRGELTGGRDGFLAVLPAAFREQKGITHAISAWSRVVEVHPEALLALVGGGDEEPVLREAVREHGLEGSVVFTGVRTDMAAVYRAADAVLLPSLVENLPTVLIEAGSAGRPVVATTVGGIPEIVLDGVTGLLCPPADPAAMAERILRLVDDPELRAAMGSQATSRIREEFSADAWVNRLGEIYREVSR